MRQHTLTILSLLSAVLLLTQHVAARCGVCGDNGIACIDANQFNMCYNGAADKTQTFKCPEGQICSRVSLKCVDAGSTTPDCDAAQGCGSCTGKTFACTSRTTFVQCSDDKPTTATGSCPKGMVCNTAKPEICSKDCGTTSVECDREAPV